MSLIAVITTLPSREQALSLARRLVERGLVACAQISQIESFYRWEGTLQQEAEWRLLLKTETRLYDAVKTAILKLHSYDLPAVHSMRLDQIHAAYATWLGSCLIDQAADAESQQ